MAETMVGKVTLKEKSKTSTSTDKFEKSIDKLEKSNNLLVRTFSGLNKMSFFNSANKELSNTVDIVKKLNLTLNMIKPFKTEFADVRNQKETNLMSPMRQKGTEDLVKTVTPNTSGTSSAISQGVAAGLAAGGVIKLIEFIAGVLADFPIITGIMKLFKLILTLLFLPLIPILKPVLLLLAGMAKVLAPIMKTIATMIEKVLGPTIDKFIIGFMDLLATRVKQLAEIFLKIFEIFTSINIDIISTVIDLILSVLTFFANEGTKVFTTILGILTWVLNFMMKHWGEIKDILILVIDWLFTSWDKIYKSLMNVGEWLKTKWGIIWQALEDVGKWFASNWDIIWKVMVDVGSWFGSKWDIIWKAMVDVGSWFGSKWNMIYQALEDAAKFVKEDWKEIDSVLKTLSSSFKDLRIMINSFLHPLTPRTEKYSWEENANNAMNKLSNNANNLASIFSTITSNARNSLSYTDTQSPSLINQGTYDSSGVYQSGMYGNAVKMNDFLVTPQGTIQTNPNDFIFGMKNPGSLNNGTNMTVNINIDKPVLTGQNDIKTLVKAIEQELYKSQRRYNSYV